jgi:ElaB/YqjD/DUF883 family membrane-anchored ribosome-binding protein
METTREHTEQERGRIIPEDVLEKGSEMYAKTQQAAGEAYEKTAQVAGETYDKTAKIMSDTYDQAKVFGRENPEKMALIAFGVGFGLGVLFCSRQSRASRSAHAVVDAIYDVAVAFLR